MPIYDAIAQAYLNRFKKPAIDTMETYLTEEHLEESRLDWLKKNTKPTYAKTTVKVTNQKGEEFDQEQEDKSRDITFAHDPHGPAKTIPDLVDHIAKHGDPTPNKVHTQWLTNIYKKGNLKQEDLSRAHSALSDYEGSPATKNAAGEHIEGTKGIKHMMGADEKVINHTTYPTVQSLRNAMDKHVSGGLPPSKISNNIKAHEASGKPGHEQVYDDEHMRVYKLSSDEHGKQASRAIYGGGTKNGGTEWCTANHSDEHNYFDHYTKEQYPGSHLYVIHHKPTGEVFQYHTHSDQFMDKSDETIKPEDVKKIQPSLHKFWDAHPEATDPPK